MPELEEPGWPNLRSGYPPAGQTFLNAFYAVSQVNARKNALEEKIRQMEMDGRIKELQYERQRDKDAEDFKYKYANLGRAYDSMALRSYMQEKGFEHQDYLKNLAASRQDARFQNAQTLGDELAAASGKYPAGSKGLGNELSYIQTKHAGTISTPEGKRVWDAFSAEQKASTKEAQRAADTLRKNFDSTLSITGTGITRKDFLQPEEAWRTNEKGERYLSRVDMPTDSGQPKRVVVNRQQELEALKSGKKVWYDTIPAKTYDQLRKMHNRMLDIGGQDVSDKPDVDLGSSKDEALDYLKKNNLPQTEANIQHYINASQSP